MNQRLPESDLFNVARKWGDSLIEAYKAKGIDGLSIGQITEDAVDCLTGVLVWIVFNDENP